MKIKAFAVVDTNVIVSALTSDSFPRDVINLIASQNVIPVFDKRMLDEYYDVLNRNKFNFSKQVIYDTLHLTISNGIFINDVEQAKTALRDKKDIPFFEVKESSSEFDTYLVTGNLKDFPEFRTTITPKEFLNVLDTLERFVQADFNYEENIEALKATQLSTTKYTSGKELLEQIFNEKTKKINKSYFEKG